MSALDALLNPVYESKTKDVSLGNRLIDPETGKPASFTLRTMNSDERATIRKRCIVTRESDGGKYNEVDNDAFLARCLVECCVNPDLKSTAFCTFPPREQGGKPIVVSPDVALKRRLLVPEYERLASAFMELNAMDEDSPAEDNVSKN